MADAYTVAARLNFTSNAPTIVAELIRNFERLDQVISGAQRGIGRLAAELRKLRGGAGGMGSVTKAIEKLSTARLGPGLLQDMEKATTAGREFAAMQEQMARSAAETAAAWREMGRSVPRAPGGGSVPPGGKPAARGGGFSHHDLLNSSIGLSIAGDSGMGFFGKAIMAEAEVAQILAGLRMNNALKDGDIARARAAAEKATQQVPGTTLAENLHHLTDAFTVMGNLNEAIEGLPALSQLAYVFKNMPGAHHGDSSFAALQAIEVMQRHVDPKTHQIDMGALNAQLGRMSQVMAGTGGRLDGSAYLGFAKQSRVGGMVHNDQYLFRDLPAMLIALGGNRAGTGDAAIWAQFVSGRMTQNAFVALRRAGLIDDRASWKGGQVKDMLHHLVGGEAFAANPVQWVRDFMLGDHGALARKGIDPHNRMEVANFLSGWASRQTGLGFFSEMILGMSNIDKESAKIGQTSANPMQVIQQNDPMQKIREFHAAENQFLVTLGQNAMGPAMEALKSLTEAVKSMSTWLAAHPEVGKNLTLIGGGLSILATGAGKAALVIYLGSPLVSGLGALAKAASPFSGGGAASGALFSVSGSLFALAGAAIAAEWALPRLLHGLAEWIGGPGTGPHPGGAQGRQPPGYRAPPQTEEQRREEDWPSRLWDSLKHGLTPGPHGPQRGQPPSHYLGPSDRPPVQLHGDITMDGRKVGEIVAREISRVAMGPSMGTTGPDIRVSPFGSLAGVG